WRFEQARANHPISIWWCLVYSVTCWTAGNPEYFRFENGFKIVWSLFTHGNIPEMDSKSFGACLLKGSKMDSKSFGACLLKGSKMNSKSFGACLLKGSKMNSNSFGACLLNLQTENFPPNKFLSLCYSIQYSP